MSHVEFELMLQEDIDRRDSQKVILCGPVGRGKTFLAWALGHRACRGDPRLPSRHSRLLHGDSARFKKGLAQATLMP